jgi:L-arabinose isomerase
METKQDAVVMLSKSGVVRVGLLGLGLEAYWSQFEGLRERLEGYVAAVEEKIGANSRTVINFGLLDSMERSAEIAHRCRTEDIDVLLVYVTTYALSSVLLPVLRRAKVPVILLNLQPAAAIDYAAFNKMTDRTAMTGEWLAYCSACPVPEIANVMTRLAMPFYQVTGMLHDDPQCWKEIEEWLRAAEVAHALEHTKLGLMGHYYSGMLDISTDLAQVSGRFGVQIEMLEVDEVSALRRDVSEEDAQRKVEEFRSAFEVESVCDSVELTRAARTSVALDRLVEERSLGVMAYYYKGTGVSENEDTMSSIILGTSLLTARGVPVAGEYEVKNALAMKIMDLLGVGGSFTEYYALDLNADLVLMGHDGPGHPGIANGKLKVRPLGVYHGKVGKGLSVEMSVKHGDVTLLSVVEDREHGFRLLIAEGESVPGDILKIGNSNSFYKFPLGARGFVEAWNAQGPAHHCAVGTGHVAGQLAKVANLLGLTVTRIC